MCVGWFPMNFIVEIYLIAEFCFLFELSYIKCLLSKCEGVLVS